MIPVQSRGAHSVTVHVGQLVTVYDLRWLIASPVVDPVAEAKRSMYPLGVTHDPAVPGTVLAAANLSEDQIDYLLTHAISSGRTIWRFGWLASYDLESGWCVCLAIPLAEVARLKSPERWSDSARHLHTHHDGPQCDSYYRYGQCDHGSCMADDDPEDDCGQCVVDAHAHVDDPQGEVWRCGQHGDVRVVDSGYNSGFAGEGLSWVNFSCGCSTAEEGAYTDM